MKRITAALGMAMLLACVPGPGSASAAIVPQQMPLINSAMRVLTSYGVVTSTFRTPAHNKAVGGVPNSYHLLDRAIDVARRAGVAHWQLDAALRRAGYKLVESLDEGDHSHFAFAAPTLATTAANIAPQQDTPASPPPKPLPRVAADEHGTLAIDLAAQDGASAEANSAAK